MVAERMPGVNMGEVWPRLGWEERAQALTGLWERAKAVHATDLSRVSGQVRRRSPFYAPTPAAAATQVHQLREQGLLAPAQRAVLLAAWIASGQPCRALRWCSTTGPVPGQRTLAPGTGHGPARR